MKISGFNIYIWGCNMSENSRIHFIPPKPPKREKRVGIYCCVSSNSADKLKSIAAQVSHLPD